MINNIDITDSTTKELPLLIICGLSGAGKSYLAQLLAQHWPHYTVIGPGLIRQKLGITTYSRKDTPRLLAAVIEDIERNHAAGKGSIVDANLKSTDLRQCFYDAARELQLPVVVIEVTCPEEVTRTRLEQREKELGERKPVAENPYEFDIYLHQKKIWQNPHLDLEDPSNDHVALLRFNSARNAIEYMRGKEAGTFVAELRKVLENN